MTAPTPADVIAATRTFVLDNYLYAQPDARLGPDDPLLGGGVLDSMGVMETIEFLHTRFGVTVDDEEITEEHFGTLAAIARLVVSKGAPAAVAA